MSEASNGIVEFLSELNEADAQVALRQAHLQKSPFIFKIDSHPHAIKAHIDNFVDKRALFNTELNEIKSLTDKEVSLKFNVGTEIYFVKTSIKSYLNRYYFDMSSKVIQLKRRKEPRFHLPSKWLYNATLIGHDGHLKCKVLDISLSGIRFEILNETTPYQRDDIVKIKFQIHKRAEVHALAIVRFALNRPGFNQIVGLEFSNEMLPVQRERVSHIIDDIKAASTASLM